MKSPITVCALGWVRPRQQKERDMLCTALQRTRGYPTNIIIPVKHPIKVRLIQFNRDYSLSLDMHVHNFLTVQRMFKMNRWMVVEKEHNNVFTSVRQTGGQFINIHVIRTCVLWRLYTDWVTCVVYECCRMNRGHNWQMAY